MAKTKTYKGKSLKKAGGGKYAKMVDALKKIEADIRAKYDDLGQKIVDRVNSIRDGRDGAAGRDGRDGDRAREDREQAPLGVLRSEDFFRRHEHAFGCPAGQAAPEEADVADGRDVAF